MHKKGYCWKSLNVIQQVHICIGQGQIRLMSDERKGIVIHVYISCVLNLQILLIITYLKDSEIMDANYFWGPKRKSTGITPKQAIHAD